MGETSETVERLRLRLKELGWTQREFAQACGASTAVVCRILSGERMPSLAMAFRIQNSALALPADAWVTHANADESGDYPAVDADRLNTG